MRKLFLFIMLILGGTFVSAQNQFTNSGNFQIFTGANVSFFGNFVNNGTFTDGGNVLFAGASSQSVSGTSATTFNNLTLNNTAGAMLQQAITISTTLTLTAGALDLNARVLTITNAAATAISRTSGYILSENVNNASKVRWNIGTNTTAHVFPFGTSSAAYIPFTLQITAGDIGNVTVSTYPTAANNTPYPTVPETVTSVNRFGSDNSANVVDRFWQIDKDGLSGTATLTFEAAAAEVGTIATLRAQRWNSALPGWEDPIAGQTSSATGVTVSGVTTFSPWTLSGNNAALPIVLLSFTATARNTEVDLNWKTASETDNDYFTVQRSMNGLEFDDIGKVDAGGANKSVQHYAFIDKHALPGKSYYRLKQTDLDGALTYSDIRMVDLDEFQPRMTAYPNPTLNGEFSIDFQHSLETQTSVTVYDLLGKVVFRGVVDQGVSTYPINMNLSPTGVYVVKALSSKSSFQQTIVLK